MKRSWWKTLLKYGIGFLLLALVIWRNWQAKPGHPGTGLEDMLHRPMQVKWYLLAAVLCGLNIFATLVRWYVLVRAQQLPFSFGSAMGIGLVGYFFNTFLPGSVGGDLVKAAFIAREQSRRTVAVSTVVIDRVVGLWGLVALIAAIGGIYWISDPSFIQSKPTLLICVSAAIAVVAASLAVWFLLGFLPERRAIRFSERLHSIPRIGGILSEFWQAVWMYRNRGLSILVALLLSWASHLCWVSQFYLCVLTFQPAGMPADMPSLAEHFLIVPMGMIAQGFIPLPGGIGGGEFVFGELYRVLGHPEAIGVSGSMGWRTLAWSFGLVGYITYLLMKRGAVPLPKATNAASPAPSAPANATGP
ncbi:MAG TPA: lysylphosphatidylglycerol synthase transmembrane domain-containing protein [Gemmataceae bacterium]|nr:lysylphosphatidylglycerol synthase transmembrane domain-containing protein [Gemmataceae bacterium]